MMLLLLKMMLLLLKNDVRRSTVPSIRWPRLRKHNLSTRKVYNFTFKQFYIQNGGFCIKNGELSIKNRWISRDTQPAQCTPPYFLANGTGRINNTLFQVGSFLIYQAPACSTDLLTIVYC